MLWGNPWVWPQRSPRDPGHKPAGAEKNLESLSLQQQSTNAHRHCCIPTKAQTLKWNRKYFAKTKLSISLKIRNKVAELPHSIYRAKHFKLKLIINLFFCLLQLVGNFTALCCEIPISVFDCLEVCFLKPCLPRGCEDGWSALSPVVPILTDLSPSPEVFLTNALSHCGGLTKKIFLSKRVSSTYGQQKAALWFLFVDLPWTPACWNLTFKS